MARRYDRQFRAAGAGGGSIGGAQVTLWDVDGNQITTGITDLNGTAIPGGVLTCDSYGYAPAFIDTADRPDIYAIGALSGTIPGVDRVHLEPTDTDDRVTALEAAVTALSGDVEDGIGDAVQTAGGSIITIPEGDTTTQALIIHLPTGDRTNGPDTFGVYVNIGTAESPTWKRTTYLNESGLLRVISIADNQVPVRIKVHTDAQTANLIEVTDLDNVALGGFAADGSVFGPNIGSARLTAGTSAPAAPRAGDLWSDLSQDPPALKMFDGSAWLVVGNATTPVAAAPAFVDDSALFVNGYTWAPSAPAGAGTLFACAAWNTIDAPSVPAGWTLVDEITTATARSAIWKAAGDVPNTTWSWNTDGAQPKVSGVILGYESCTVVAHDKLAETAADGTHTAPDINVPDAPATLLRVWWDKSSGTTSITLPGGVTQRGVQYGTGTSCAVIAADAEVALAGSVGTADATFNVSNVNAGGYSLALVAV